MKEIIFKPKKNLVQCLTCELYVGHLHQHKCRFKSTNEIIQKDGSTTRS